MLTKYLKDKDHAEPAADESADEAGELRAAIEERDAAINRLEQTLADQIARIETLEQELEQAKFKTGILEQSYSTQLSDAREHAATIEKSMTDTQARNRELEAGYKELENKLAEANAKLDYFGPETESIDELLESSSVRDEQPNPQGSDEMIDAPIERETTEEMLAPDIMFAGTSE